MNRDRYILLPKRKRLKKKEQIYRFLSKYTKILICFSNYVHAAATPVRKLLSLIYHPGFNPFIDRKI